MSKLIPTGTRIPAWQQHGGFVTWEPSDGVTPLEAVQAVGLDTPVTTHPIYDSNLKEIPRKVETRRDGNHMAIVGKDTYHVKTFLDHLLPIVTGISMETPYNVVAAGKYANGAKEIMVLEWPQELLVAGQAFKGSLWVANSHDGSSAQLLGLHKTRISCTNEVPAFGRIAQIKMRHRGGGISVEEARAILQVSLKYDEVFEAKVEAELYATLKEETFEEFVNKQFAPLTLEDGTKKTGRGLTMAVNAQEALWESYNAPDLKEVRGTLFQATQAVYAYYDWAYGGTSEVKRAERALDGKTDGLKMQGRNALYALV